MLILLDMLPWPWGEDILVGLFMATGLIRPSRRRAALSWAKAHGAARPWRLAARVCGFLGHWVARMRTLGFRRPADLRENLRVEGAEHLEAIPGGAILLGFHLGISDGDIAFRALGYPVTLIGGSDREETATWWGEAWQPLVAPKALSFAAGDPDRWSAVLYTARRILLEGEKIYILADGEGREAFHLPLSFGEWSLRAGWIALHRLTGAPVLPVFRRLEGRRQVIAIHPPLPALSSDPRSGLEAWRGGLTRLVEDHVRRFPEQCPHLALVLRLTTVGGAAAPSSTARRAATE